MAYNIELEERIDRIVSRWNKIDSRKMFGSVWYLIDEKMFCGVFRDYLMLRLGEDGAAEAVKSPDVVPFENKGRPMKGWVMVDADGYGDEDDLRGWLKKARRFADSLPPK